jgi:zinc finger protein
LANSYIQDLCYPDPDKQLQIVEYTRSEQQNDDLGLNDMKVDNY